MMLLSDLIVLKLCKHLHASEDTPIKHELSYREAVLVLLMKILFQNRGGHIV